MSRGAALRGGCLALALGAVSFAPIGAKQGTAPESEWYAFQGSWSASAGGRVSHRGRRRSHDRRHFWGRGPHRRRGARPRFSAEAIGFVDGRGTSVGRCVWTDDKGDRIFSILKGEDLQTASAPSAPSRAARGATQGSKASTPSPGSSLSHRGRRDSGRTVSLVGRVRRAGGP